MKLYQLTATGGTAFGFVSTYHSKDVFTKKELAEAGIPKFIENCCDDSFANYMINDVDHKISVKIIELNLIEEGSV